MNNDYIKQREFVMKKIFTKSLLYIFNIIGCPFYNIHNNNVSRCYSINDIKLTYNSITCILYQNVMFYFTYTSP